MRLDTYAITSDTAPYSRSELRSLWSEFKDESDADEKLAGFASCSLGEARILIADFRAAEAARTALAPKKDKDPPKTESAPVAADTDSYVDCEDDGDISPDLFPDDSMTAALLNVRHGYSIEIVAEGRQLNGRKVVLVEKTRDESGKPFFRTKITEYHYHKSRRAAMSTARKTGIDLQSYGDSNKE